MMVRVMLMPLSMYNMHLDDEDDEKSTWKYQIHYDYDHERYNDDDRCEYHNEDKYDDGRWG